MSNKKYGPQTAEIEALIGRIKTLTPEQFEALSNVALSEESWDARRNAEQAAVRIALLAEAREELWDVALEAAREALGDEIWEEPMEMKWFVRVYDALLALLVRDLITAEEFKILCGPWASVMCQRIPVANETPVTETELLRQRLADAEAKVEELTTEVEELEADLAKFHPCDEGRCMIDDSTPEYAEAEDHPFKVYHKDGE